MMSSLNLSNQNRYFFSAKYRSTVNIFNDHINKDDNIKGKLIKKSKEIIIYPYIKIMMNIIQKKVKIHIRLNKKTQIKGKVQLQLNQNLVNI